MSTAVSSDRSRSYEPPPTETDDGAGSGGSGRVPHRTLILVAAVVVVLVAALTWLVAFSSVLGVKHVTVRGTHTVTPNQVLAAADITTGTPLLRLDTGSVARRIEALPDVADATVSTAYPNTVVITLTERVSVGYLVSGSGFVLVDKTGDQFRTQKAKPANLPLFALPSGPSATAAGHAVATVAASLPRSLLAEVASIQAFDPTEITLLLTDHRVVRWGMADGSADKARILPALLRQRGSQFDVSNPDQPFTH